MPDADIAVVGAGAAGLTAAIAAARASSGKLKVLLLDSRKKIGAKILVSGGTRCNVTNVEVLPSDYQGGPRHFLKHVLAAFTPAETIEFFREIGVELVLEPTGKYFPTTHSGKTVLEALVRALEEAGAVLVTEARVAGLRAEGEKGFLLETEDGRAIAARRVILATGGLSLPETGSDGKGLAIARGLGHTIVPTFPALTPLETDDEGWKSLSGVTLEARLSFFRKGKKAAESEGSFLFTHFGYSGPSALDISRHFAAAPPSEKPAVEASFVPSETEESLGRRFADYAKEHSERRVRTFLSEVCGLPARFCEVFLEKTGIDGSVAVGRSARQRGKLVHSLLHLPLAVTGVVGYKKAEATAGGVSLSEVRVSTLESRIVPGLHFAGEMLDVDGRIGGFNFQWAWSSGTVAGRAAARALLS
ncbi:MAG TPA: aminoacetone oxidase family FAD-binding enzyme [Candidatus Eisenbacteria bacterium]|nr:aminoacetone oxidase family FAD-binding enzyme [Candidatus Eisenbacteria bacterium]